MTPEEQNEKISRWARRMAIGVVFAGGIISAALGVPLKPGFALGIAILTTVVSAAITWFLSGLFLAVLTVLKEDAAKSKGIGPLSKKP